MTIMPFLNKSLVFLVLVWTLSCARKEHRHYDASWKEFNDDSKNNSGKEDDQDSKNSPSENLATHSNDSEDELNIDSNRIVFKARFQGKLIADQMALLPEVIKPKDSILMGYAQDDLLKITAKPVDLVAEQNYGNPSSATLKQTVNSPTDQTSGLKWKMFVGDSTSGAHEYRRVNNNPACPAAMVCIDQVRSFPLKGTPRTFCYKDPETLAPIAIPIGVAPGVTRKDLEDLLANGQGFFGPFLVQRYASVDIDCAKITAATTRQTEVTIKASINDNSYDMELAREASGGRRIDYGISFQVFKHGNDLNGNPLGGPNDLPYVDELTGMQAATTYFVNEKEKNLEVISKEIRKAISLPYASGWAMGYEGLLVQIYFSMCHDLLKPRSTNQCQDSGGGSKK